MAQNNLGCLYRDGRGVIQDYKTASTLFRMAAEQGNNHARTNLGWLYERGYGVTQDYRQALQLYTEAAQEYRDFETGRQHAGHPMAQNNLGCLYRDGKGTKADAFTRGKVVPQISRSRQSSRPPQSGHHV